MRAQVDQSGCIGCGLCVSTCPQVFALNSEHKAEAKAQPVPTQWEADVRQAAQSCPVDVIALLA